MSRVSNMKCAPISIDGPDSVIRTPLVVDGLSPRTPAGSPPTPSGLPRTPATSLQRIPPSTFPPAISRVSSGRVSNMKCAPISIDGPDSVIRAPLMVDGLSPRTPAGSPPTPSGLPGTPATSLQRIPPSTLPPAISRESSGQSNADIPTCGYPQGEIGEARRARAPEFGYDSPMHRGGGGQGTVHVPTLGDLLPGSSCSNADLHAYGLILGVDLSLHPDFHWVVQEAFASSLPKSWTEHTDEDGSVYFFDELSQHSSWEHPMDTVYKQLLGFVIQVRTETPVETIGFKNQRTAAIRRYLHDVHNRASEQLASWNGPYTSEVGEYYYNSVLGVSSWHCPIEDWEIELATCERVLWACLLPNKPARVSRVTLRAVAWTILVLNHWLRGSSRRRAYSLDSQVDAVVIREIDLDIPRTAGGDHELSGSLGVTRSLLLRHAAEDSELGYCQGMNMIASLFTVATQNQDEAYARFRAVVQNLRGLWLPGFPLLLTGMAQFEVLAEARPWFKHLCRHHIQPDMYLPGAWMTFFSKWLPLPTRVLFLSKLEMAGLAGLLAVSLALLDLHLQWLMHHDEMDDLLASLAGLGARAPDAAVLLATTEAWLPEIASVAETSLARSMKSRVPLLKREGSRVLDSSGREALHVGISKKLSSLWAYRKPRSRRALT